MLNQSEISSLMKKDRTIPAKRKTKRAIRGTRAALSLGTMKHNPAAKRVHAMFGKVNKSRFRLFDKIWFKKRTSHSRLNIPSESINGLRKSISKGKRLPEGNLPKRPGKQTQN